MIISQVSPIHSTYLLTLTDIRCILLLFFLLAPGRLPADVFVRSEIIAAPTPELFSVCFGHTCATVETDSLSGEEWRIATEPLSAPSATASEERAAIARSIALLEEIVGRHTGTYRDKGRNMSGLGQTGQLDCIDESTNTTTYLRMLERSGLLVHHEVVDRSTRFGLFVGMPHTTAVIRENHTDTRYAVDSWFLDNGQPPYIARLEIWKSGGAPGDD